MEPASHAAGSVTRRGLRPLLWWIVLSSLLFLWHYHEIQARKATMRFMISMEGRQGQVFHEATLNDLPYRSGERCGVGWKKLLVQAQDAVPFETNLFVWYGGASFGNVTLARMRAQMDLDCFPAAESVRVTGAEEQKKLGATSRESLSLPTGRYTVEAKFARFNVERTVDITWNQTTRVTIAPSLTTLRLSSDPDKADFELHSKAPPEVSVGGSAPITITGLPAGEYELAIARGDYRKNLSVRLLGTKPTNELNVKFRYAKLSFTSEPTDATIDDGSRLIGHTPASFDLQPGSYRFQIAKDGYFGTNFSLVLSDTDVRTVSVSLVNVSFVEAIERARQEVSSFSPDFDRALADVEKASQIKPSDETAIQLKQMIRFRQHIRNSKQLAANGDFTHAFAEAEAALKLGVNDAEALALKSELEKGQQEAAIARAEARRTHPQKVLHDLTYGTRYNELFEPQLMRFTNSLDTVRAAVVRALGRKPEWSIRRNDKPDGDTAIIYGDTKGFGWKQNVVLIVGQTADNEVTLCFKTFAYTLGENIQLTIGGVTDDSYKPLHPKYVSALRAPFVEKQRATDIQAFKKRIQDELP